MARPDSRKKGSDRARIRNITDSVTRPEDRMDAPDAVLSQEELARRKMNRRRRQEVLQRRRRIRRRRRMIAYLKILTVFIVIAGVAVGVYILKNYSTGRIHDDRGMTALQEGDHEQAVREFKEAVSYDQENALFLTHLGMAYIGSGSYEEALGYFIQAEGCADEDEEKILLCRGRGIACLYQGNSQEAADAFEKALSYDQEQIRTDLKKDILYYQAEALEKTGDLAAADESYSQILTLASDEAAALMKRGLVREQMGEDEKAIGDLRQAIKKSGKSYAVYKALYQALTRQGKTEDARAVLDEALQLPDNSGEGLYDRGNIYLELGETDQAMECMEQSYAKGCAAGMAGQGQAAYLAGDYEKACSCFEKYLSVKGISASDPALAASSWNQYAVCLLELEKYEEAVEACENGLALGEREADQSLRFNLTAAYEKQLLWEDAYAVMKDYHEKYPNDEKGTHEYEFLESRTGQ